MEWCWRLIVSIIDMCLCYLLSMAPVTLRYAAVRVITSYWSQLPQMSITSLWDELSILIRFLAATLSRGEVRNGEKKCSTTLLKLASWMLTSSSVAWIPNTSPTDVIDISGKCSYLICFRLCWMQEMIQKTQRNKQWKDLQTLMQLVCAENSFHLAGIPQRKGALYAATRKMLKETKPRKRLWKCDVLICKNCFEVFHTKIKR